MDDNEIHTVTMNLNNLNIPNLSKDSLRLLCATLALAIIDMQRQKGYEHPELFTFESHPGSKVVKLRSDQPE